MMQPISLLDAIRSGDENLLDRVRALLLEGADPSECTKYFETPLRLASRRARFDVVELLFQSGADPTHLNWTPIFHAIAYGSLEDVERCIQDGAGLKDRDTWECTPLIVAVQTGNTKKVECLISAGASILEAGRCNQPTWQYAIETDDSEMLRFLIQKGCDFEQYNDFGYTPLIQASNDGAIECVKELLRHDANIHKTDRSPFSQISAIGHASNLSIVKMLMAGGAGLSDINDRARAKLLNLDQKIELRTDKSTYLKQNNRTFGESNPQKCEFEFWYDMVRAGVGAWHAKNTFEDQDNPEPVWCYDRFGKSLTSIGDNEYIEIAGEHEDSYDPDFCIYNDVFHHRANGEIVIYEYPRDLFPPTDFHTATLVENHIYIIGNLGYPGERLYGTTPVYELDIESFEIQPGSTSGDMPGWIYNHSATLKNPSTIRIQGGDILEMVEDTEQHRFNSDDFELDLNTLTWTRHQHVPLTGITPCIPEEYKHFRHSDGALLAIESNNKWQLLKINSMHRIDVVAGQKIYFEEETFTASSEDFMFCIAYSTSEKFDNYEMLESAVKKNAWHYETICSVCRPNVFPAYDRHIGFEKVSAEERDEFRSWLSLYERRKAKIL